MMTKTVRSAVVIAMIGAATLASMGIADAAPLDDPDTPLRVVPPGPGPDPRTAGMPQEQLIIDYLTQVMGEFDAAARASDPFERAEPAQELEVTTRTYSSGATRTVVATVYRRLGGAPSSTWYHAFSHHGAERLTVDGLFRSDATALPVIASIVARELSVRLGQPVPVGLDPSTYRNFALTDDAVVFFFDQHQLHPALGATEVSVPRAAVAAMLAPGL